MPEVTIRLFCCVAAENAPVFDHSPANSCAWYGALTSGRYS
jgi:hypothetical protein